MTAVGEAVVLATRPARAMVRAWMECMLMCSGVLEESLDVLIICGKNVSVGDRLGGQARLQNLLEKVEAEMVLVL